MTTSRFRSVIFDFDYTLADSSEGAVECVNYALKSMGLPQAAGVTIRATIGMALKDIYKSLTGDTRQSRAMEFARLFAIRADQVMLDHTVLFDFVKAPLRRLEGRGLSLAIVSTKFRYRIEAFLRRECLFDAFKVIVGGEDVKEHKPDPTGIRLALQRLACNPAEAVYVGDSTVDAEAAARASIPFIAVLSGVTTRQAFRKYGPLSVIDDVRFLPALLLPSEVGGGR